MLCMCAASSILIALLLLGWNYKWMQKNDIGFFIDDYNKNFAILFLHVVLSVNSTESSRKDIVPRESSANSTKSPRKDIRLGGSSVNSTISPGKDIVPGESSNYTFVYTVVSVLVFLAVLVPLFVSRKNGCLAYEVAGVSYLFFFIDF